MCQFDSKVRLLRHEKLGLDWELKQADLHLLMLYQELLIHVEFQMKEASLQEQLDKRVEEENGIMVRRGSRSRGRLYAAYEPLVLILCRMKIIFQKAQDHVVCAERYFEVQTSSSW